MSLHGDLQVNARAPRAAAVCDRCGRLTQHDRLQWQFDWQQGPRLFNLRILVCSACLDVPQESGRTIVLPPDPVPILDPRPEDYVSADNPISALGYNPQDLFFPGSSISANIGTMTNNAGVDGAFTFVGQSSAFNSTSVTALFSPNTKPIVNKRAEFSAALSISNSSFQNTVGKNWNANPSNITATTPSTVAAITHIVSRFTAYAPNDQPFLRTGATSWLFQGSSNGVTYTTLSSGTTAGTIGETLTVNTTSVASYQFHQFALKGDGISAVAVAGLSISVSDGPANDI